MPGIARQFEPQITRSGGAPAKYRFIIRCSGCASTDAYEAAKPTSSATVRNYFDERGWLLGRDRSYDLCPACLAQPQRAQETKSSSQPQHHRLSADQRRRDTADILARHLGKPEALAADVFRPREATSGQPAPSRAPQQVSPPPSLSSEVEQTMTAMAADLKGLRAAVELIADQMGKLVALGGQQIEVIARLAPALLQSTGELSGSLRHVASAVQAIPPRPLPAIDPQPTPETESGTDEARAGDAAPAATPMPLVQQSPKGVQGKRAPKGKAHQAPSAAVGVKSIPDAKRSDRFYTSIRLTRELWDRTGFGPEDRLLLDWSGKVLTIERATEGGVKPKSIGDTSVVLQSWKLGNLNFDQPNVTSGRSSLRLSVGRDRQEP
jgi:hypothetical protein